jgi:hypothetical protein
LLQSKPLHGDSFFTRCTTASLRISDPIAFVPKDKIAERKETSHKSLRWPYQQSDTLTADHEESWIGEVVTAQRASGANMILSPGRYLPGNDPSSELDLTIRQSELTTAVVGNREPTALNLTISRQWLIDPRRRDDLLERLVEHKPAAVWLRTLWSPVATGGQPVDADLLAGYRELCETAASESIPLLLPSTDLTGWLGLAWGARGFGTGISPAGRMFVPNLTGPPGNVVPKQRFLEPGLLHTILREEHRRLVDLDLAPECDCPYCSMARTGRPWTADIQGCHHVTVVAALTAALPSSRQEWPYEVKPRVEEAARLAVAVNRELTFDSASTPRHLPVWAKLLS